MEMLDLVVEKIQDLLENPEQTITEDIADDEFDFSQSNYNRDISWLSEFE